MSMKPVVETIVAQRLHLPALPPGVMLGSPTNLKIELKIPWPAGEAARLTQQGRKSHATRKATTQTLVGSFNWKHGASERGQTE